jgi:hypothetical protein
VTAPSEPRAGRARSASTIIRTPRKPTVGRAADVEGADTLVDSLGVLSRRVGRLLLTRSSRQADARTWGANVRAATMETSVRVRRSDRARPPIPCRGGRPDEPDPVAPSASRSTLCVAARRIVPATSHPCLSSGSARYDPSCPADPGDEPTPIGHSVRPPVAGIAGPFAFSTAARPASPPQSPLFSTLGCTKVLVCITLAGSIVERRLFR